MATTVVDVGTSESLCRKTGNEQYLNAEHLRTVADAAQAQVDDMASMSNHLPTSSPLLCISCSRIAH